MHPARLPAPNGGYLVTSGLPQRCFRKSIRFLTFLVGLDLLSGGLVEVLPDYRCAEFGVYVVHPTCKNVSLKVRGSSTA